jgi:glycosyltransferase involved in cell wall biosynthesis
MKENIQERKTDLSSQYELFQSAEMQPSYLDHFDLSKYSSSKITAIIPTYNRCPNSVEHDSNPLGWCLESLLSQQGGVLEEIIVMDDCSEDYTPEVVKDFQNKSNIEIKYFKNDQHKGSSITKNLAARKSTNEQIIFLDDDCIFSRYFMFGANYTFNHLPADKGALHMPVYHRKLLPEIIDIREIGKIDLENGIMVGNHGGFPSSYLENINEYFLEDNLKILKPFEIVNLAGIFAINKTLFNEIGGFPEFFTWKNGYREEAFVSLELVERGKKSFLTPDPKFYCVHLKYGSRGKENEILNAPQKLRRLISESSIERKSTGNRVDPEDWFFSRIISTYVTLGKRDLISAEKYKRKVQKEFVIDNSLSVSGFGYTIDNFSRREEIFKLAIDEGNKLIGVVV